jgi:hypothetical protein
VCVCMHVCVCVYSLHLVDFQPEKKNYTDRVEAFRVGVDVCMCMHMHE